VKLNLLPEWAQEKFAEYAVEEAELEEAEEKIEEMQMGGIQQ
jgi:hypothetical protein